MAYDTSKLTKLAALKDLAERISAKIESIDGETNVIEGITVNGEAATITDKIAAITVPTEEDIAAAVAAAGHASFQTAESVPTADTAEENILYLVMNADTGYYDIYALIGEEVVRLDDTSVSLGTYTAYDSGLYKITVNENGFVTAAVAVTAEDIEALGAAITDTTYDAATTETDGLMSASDKEKLDSIEIATDDEVTEMLDEVLA